VTALPQVQSLAQGRIDAISEVLLVLAIPGTHYRLHLSPRGRISPDREAVGQRVSGQVEARGLRLWRSRGGGRFIEPVDGPPRIIAGIVRHVDVAGNRLLIDASVPIWVTLQPADHAAAHSPGDLVNCYVESGTSFAPAGAA
jgi:hypothetical protein